VTTDKIRYDLRDGIALITFDDGKVNAISHEVIDGLDAALARAENEARAVLLAGRDKRLSAGFDLSVMTGGIEAARALVTAGAELMLRIYTFPLPVVVACTGHALAAGAILLLASDWRAGAGGEFKIGLNEVAIGLTLPLFALELARDRLSKRHFSAAVTQARIFDPKGALDAGFLDSVEPPETLLDASLRRAAELAKLPDAAFRETKARERAATVKSIRDTLSEDMLRLMPPQS
jgi:enoyl-CoA hydratase